MKCVCLCNIVCLTTAVSKDVFCSTMNAIDIVCSATVAPTALKYTNHFSVKILWKFALEIDFIR